MFDETVGFYEDPVARLNYREQISCADAYSVLLPEFSNYLPKHAAKPISYIPNGIHLPSSLEGDKHKKRILFTSRFDTAKRPQWLINAFAKVAEKYPDWSLHMYGSGTDSEEAVELCQSLGVPNQIKLHGAQPDLTEAYQNAEIFCIPSHFEGFSNSLAEAMSYQLACVAVDDCISNSALLKDGAGYLTRVEDGAAGLAEALDTLMGNPELRKQLGTAARQKISAFTPERVTDEWDSFLKSVKSDYKQKKRLFARA
ncbi:glycosyltransferase [Pseudovibrio denitrificans]|nr:glycosyltransferase [Pseudovibrio denitrificans]